METDIKSHSKLYRTVLFGCQQIIQFTSEATVLHSFFQTPLNAETIPYHTNLVNNSQYTDSA